MLDPGLLVLRLAVGLIFAAHGAQKAFGVWGGPGIEGWRGAVQRMGYEPPEPFVVVSIGAELVGGILLAIGLFTPVAAAIVIAQSIVIIASVHWPKGFFNSQGGFEFPLLIGLAAIAICLIGAGGWSVDSALGLPFPDPIRAALLPLAFAGGVAAYLWPRGSDLVTHVPPPINPRNRLRRD